MWLTRLALRNPVLILMMSLMVIALGAVSLSRLSVDLFPQIDLPVVRVATFYTGAGPQDIEKSITQPIERAVSASPGVEHVESVSKQGASVVTVFFQYGTNLDNAQFDVSQRVAQVLNALPPGIQQPIVLKFDITNIPVASVAVSSDELDEKQLYDLAYNTIEPQLERLTGVASATVGGGKTRQIQVEVDRDALRARNLDILDVVNAVKSSNLLLPSGSLKADNRNYNVFANTQVDDTRPLASLVIKPGQGGLATNATSPVRLSDVAHVVDSTADQDDIVRINGRRGVYLRVLKQPGANTIGVVDALRAELTHLVGVPGNVHLDISFDQSAYIRAAVKGLEHEALQGGALAILVILIFLASVRATGIVSVAIPLSVIATFVLLYFWNQTLNVFTLGGLALGVGRLVDDSIVELENIHRHLESGQSRRSAVLNAAQEVAMPILVSTITTIVVFFPVLFLPGVARNLFLPLAMTIAFALIMSFFVSRTVTPLLCYYWLRPGGGHGKVGGAMLRFFDRMDHAYARVLRRALQHRFLVVGGIFAMFVLTVALLGPRLGTEFFPDSDESQFSVSYKAPIGTRVESTEKLAERLEKGIRDALGAEAASVKQRPGASPSIWNTMISDSGIPGGRAGIFSQNNGPYMGSLQVNLVPPAERKLTDLQAAEKVRKAITDAVPGTQVYLFTGGIVKRILNFGSSAPIDVEILGYDLDAAAPYAKQIAEALRKSPHLTDVQISREENYPELDVNVDREKAGVLGISEQQVAQAVLTSLLGNTQFTPIPFTDPKTGNEYYINVRMADAYRSHVADLGDVMLRAPSGKLVQLDTLAKVVRNSGPVTINRKYLQRIIDVTANVAPGSDLGSASADAQAALDSIPPPENFSAHLGGQTAAQKQAFGGLAFAAVLALALVYMVLASQFKSLIDPLVIMFSVPMGVSGVILMLLATHTTLNVNSFMGIIMMVGIVVSNGVLLVDFANVLRGRGKDLMEATIEAGRTRLRPILMTTLATVVGLIPMAAGIGEGSETNLPLARAVIGGLTFSTIFTLFLVPSLYTLLDRFAKRRAPGEGDEDEPAGAGEPVHA